MRRWGGTGDAGKDGSDYAEHWDEKLGWTGTDWGEWGGLGGNWGVLEILGGDWGELGGTGSDTGGDWEGLGGFAAAMEWEWGEGTGVILGGTRSTGDEKLGWTGRD